MPTFSNLASRQAHGPWADSCTHSLVCLIALENQSHSCQIKGFMTQQKPKTEKVSFATEACRDSCCVQPPVSHSQKQWCISSSPLHPRCSWSCWRTRAEPRWGKPNQAPPARHRKRPMAASSNTLPCQPVECVPIFLVPRALSHRFFTHPAPHTSVRGLDFVFIYLTVTPAGKGASFGQGRFIFAMN